MTPRVWAPFSTQFWWITDSQMPCHSSSKIMQGGENKHVDLPDFEVEESIKLNYLIYRICYPKQIFSFSQLQFLLFANNNVILANTV